MSVRAVEKHEERAEVGDFSAEVARFEFDVVTPLALYRAEVRCADRKMIGPAYPIDAFSQQDGNLLRLAIGKSLLRSCRIGDRAYVTGQDLDTFAGWTDERVYRPRSWKEDLEQVTAALDDVDRLVRSGPVASPWPFHSPTDSGRARIDLHSAPDDIPGPIVPIGHFCSDLQQVLSWCIRESLIPSIILDGIAYLSYSDVYGRLLSNYFEDEYDHPAAWDGTYAETWSSWRRVWGRFVKPQGFKDAVPNDFFPRISLRREVKHMEDEKGELRSLRAAYPRNVADRAAEMVLALYREDGFTERFGQYQYDDAERDASEGDRIERLSSFGSHEIDWLRRFAAEGGVRIVMLGGEEYVAVSDLMYYDLFAAKIVEEQIGPGGGPAVDDSVEVMLDGTFCRGWPWQRSTCLRREGGTAAAS